MSKVTVCISALFLALGLLSGCGEKQDEAPKAEAPAQDGMSGMSGMAAQEGMDGMSGMAAQEGMDGMSGMTAQEGMDGMSGMAAQEGMDGMSGMAAQEGMSGMSGMAAQEGMSGMSGMAAQEGMDGMSGMTAQEGMDGMSGMAAQEGMSGMSGMAAQEGMSGMSGMESAGIDGEKVYKSICMTCHDTGIAGSPKLGDKAEWGPRIATGMDTLYHYAINGKNDVPGKVMLPKGGNPSLSDAEVKAAVDYMVSKAQ